MFTRTVPSILLKLNILKIRAGLELPKAGLVPVSRRDSDTSGRWKFEAIGRSTHVTLGFY